jgi:DNA-binding PadR family transcriptional regulator
MPISHTLLGLLEREPMHGYRLRQQSKEVAWIYPMASASIYPALHDLESKGFVVHRQEIHNGRSRKVYEITVEGRSELARWLSGAPNQPMTLRDRMLLQLSMQTDESIKRSRLWIEQQVERLRQETERHERRLKDVPDLGAFERMSLEYGIDMLKLRARYFERLVEHAAGESATPATSHHAPTSTAGARMAAAGPTTPGSML